MIVLGATVLFAACSDDNSSNPTLQQPDTFVLASPAFVSAAVDLASTESLVFNWGMPDYGGFPVAATYQVQLSLDGSYKVSYKEAAADESGATVADYYEFDPVIATSASVSGEDVAKAVCVLGQWEENEVPETQAVHIRVKSILNGAENVFSNEVVFTAVPYYVALSAAGPQIWYLIGSCVGDGSWGSGIGTQVTPMFTKQGESYDAVDGAGVITWTGYLTTAGFKLVKVPGAWDDQWGQGADGYVKNDGGSGNIVVPADGYYTIELDTKKDILTIEPYDGDPEIFGEIFITGGFDDWAVSTLLNPVHTYDGAINHDWYYVLDCEDTEIKFTIEGWGTNWGAETFPYGYGQNNGPNIPVVAGSYIVVFNDITGAYTFITK